MTKFKVIRARLMSGYEEGDIVDFPNKDDIKEFVDGFGGRYKRVD